MYTERLEPSALMNTLPLPGMPCATVISIGWARLSFDVGIRFAVVPHHKGAPVHGMTRLNEEGTIFLCLTIRKSRADIFWFSLFHEIAHILNGDFIDDEVYVQTEEAELEADRLAANLLISEESYAYFLETNSFNPRRFQFGERQQCPGVHRNWKTAE